MSVINTNTASNIAQNAIRTNEQQMSVAMERLSTGSRINSAKDDAAGLAISERMSSQISGLNMATRNANDAISMLQTIEGATKEISNMLGRMRELTVQSASGTYTSTDRAALDLEFGALMDEISRIAKNTEWNGDGVLQGTLGQNYSADDTPLAKTIQIGTDSGQTMALSIKTWVPTVASADTDTIGSFADGDGDDSAYGADTALFGGAANDGAVSTVRLNITSVANTVDALQEIDNAINGAAAERAKYGAYMSRLQHAADNLQNVSTNTAASRSQIADADYAAETTELARTQIISQASTAMLAQANQVKQTVLSLLK
ncbi:flagellin [Gammaproteobacteria bacterium]|nr:flagellin [Gammaproteobacteria bacterium]